MQQSQQQVFNRSAGPTQAQSLPHAHQATIGQLDKYYGQPQQAAQPLATNATITGSNNNKLLVSNEVDEKLRRFNVSIREETCTIISLIGDLVHL